MDRRTLLTALGTAAASAGCLTTTDGPDDTVTPLPTGTANETATPTSPPTPSDTFAGVPCPTVERSDRTVCHHTAGESDDVVMIADPEVFDPSNSDDSDAHDFTLYNRGDWTVLTNPYDWMVYRFDDDTWVDATPDRAVAEPLYILEPGQTLDWQVVLGEEQASMPGYAALDLSLDAGTYAFGVTGTYGGTNLTETPTGEPPAETAFLALFELESPLEGTATPSD
jgi:hypothetical protein